MSDALMEMERLAEAQRPSADELRATMMGHLNHALEALSGLVAHGTPGAAQWQRKLDGLVREISGGGRKVYGAARGAQLEPVGPLVDISIWCSEMIYKIEEFKKDYLASHAEHPADFPRERMAGDWQLEVSQFQFVPSRSEAAQEPEVPPDTE